MKTREGGEKRYRGTRRERTETSDEGHQKKDEIEVRTLKGAAADKDLSYRVTSQSFLQKKKWRLEPNCAEH